MPGQMVEFASNGSHTHGYLAKPPSGSGPGVIVIQEWWGLVDQIKDVAKRYFNRNQLLTTALLPAEFVGAAGLPKAEEVLRRAAPTTRLAAEDPASQVKKTVLPDGTILLTKRISTSPLVVMQSYALGGLTAEDAKTNGLGNLTMQMLSRGTKTRDAQQIATFFDSIGGDLSAACDNNYWSWTASCRTRSVTCCGCG